MYMVLWVEQVHTPKWLPDLLSRFHSLDQQIQTHRPRYNGKNTPLRMLRNAHMTMRHKNNNFIHGQTRVNNAILNEVGHAGQ